jgi:hypothetical protein
MDDRLAAAEALGPELVGLPVSVAVARITKAGLTVRQVTRERGWTQLKVFGRVTIVVEDGLVRDAFAA